MTTPEPATISRQQQPTPAATGAGDQLAPLVVDLDGTLVATDTLVESLIKLAKQSPLALFAVLLRLLAGRAAFKQAVASRSNIDARRLPYRDELLVYLRQQQEMGRKLVLATAAHRSVASAVARHLGLFDLVLASDDQVNLKGGNKLTAIRQHVGQRFVYAGDAAADVPIWRAAEAAILVGVRPGLAAAVRRSVSVERQFADQQGSAATWLKALRVHQWLKNLLLFVPILTSFTFLQWSKLGANIAAFIAFCLAASATYLLNDCWDLDSDRAHPRKRNRPLASGRIGLVPAIVVAAVLLLAALSIAALVAPAFLALLGIYLVMTTAYSLVMKQYVLVDVLMLSLLYTLRILAGAAAIGVATSHWLLAFSVFIFLSLALVKRCAELQSLQQSGGESTPGRDYRTGDLVVLWPLGVGAAVSAVVVFGLFISARETAAHYATPELLWGVALFLVYWVARLWIKTSRGEMHDDPLVYAVSNRGSLVTVAAMVAVVLAAYFVKLDLPL